MENSKVKILVVDDSSVSRSLMTHLLSINPLFEVIGTAENGEEALEFIQKTPPDLVFTDIVMPKMNGFELTKKIMEKHPLPVIVVSGIYSREEIKKGFEAIEAGALSILEKPKGLNDAQFIETIRFMGDTLEIMLKMMPERDREKPILAQVNEQMVRSEPIEAIAIGASLGGPKTLRSILSELSSNVKSSIFIVQHISPGFIEGFVDWLKSYSNLPVTMAVDFEKVQPGHVYVAPDGFHMEITTQRTISLVKDPEPGHYVPSAARLFRSVANAYGNRGMGIRLTGASKDGIEELKYIKEKGGVTVAERSSMKFDGEETATVESIIQLLKGVVIVSP